MIFAVDFDGTLHFGKFPDVGEPNYKLIEKIKELKENGHKIVLNTCRNGKYLDPVIAFCEKYNIEPDKINDDVDEIIEKWKDDRSRKISADLYVDDLAIKPEELIWMIDGINDIPNKKDKYEISLNEIKTLKSIYGEYIKLLHSDINFANFKKELSSLNQKFAQYSLFKEELFIQSEYEFGNVIIENDILTCIYNNKLHKYNMVKRRALPGDLVFITSTKENRPFNNETLHKSFEVPDVPENRNVNNNHIVINMGVGKNILWVLYDDQYVVLEKMNIIESGTRLV